MYSKIFLIAGLLSFIVSTLGLSHGHDGEPLGVVLVGIGIAIPCIKFLANSQRIKKKLEIHDLELELKALELKKQKLLVQEQLRNL